MHNDLRLGKNGDGDSVGVFPSSSVAHRKGEDIRSRNPRRVEAVDFVLVDDQGLPRRVAPVVGEAVEVGIE